MNVENCQVDSTKNNSDYLEDKRKIEAPGPMPFIYIIFNICKIQRKAGCPRSRSSRVSVCVSRFCVAASGYSFCNLVWFMYLPENAQMLDVRYLHILNNIMHNIFLMKLCTCHEYIQQCIHFSFCTGIHCIHYVLHNAQFGAQPP